jgi:hypothetical protein
MLVPGSLVFTPTSTPWWTWTPGADWRHPEGPGSSLQGSGDSSRGAGLLGRRLGLYEVVWKATSDGSRVGVRREGRPGRTPLRLGRRVVARRPLHGQHLAGEVSRLQCRRGRIRRDGTGRVVPGERLRLIRHGRQCLGMVQRPIRSCALSPARGTGVLVNPAGRRRSGVPSRDPSAAARSCAAAAFCSRYRPGARQGCAPDTGQSHVGFRCVRSARRSCRNSR